MLALSPRRTRPLLGWLTVSFLCYGQAPAIDPETKYEGKPIRELLFEPSKQPVSRAQLGISLRIRPNDKFNSKELSRAIQRLYETGRFEQIIVDAVESGDGVSLTFKTSPKSFIGRVTVEGVPEPPSRIQLVNAAKLDIGTEFREDELPEASNRLSEMLRANGFYTAQVRWSIIPKPDTQQSDIVFSVTPGPRAKFTRPLFEGIPAEQEKSLIRKSGWQRWYGLRGWNDYTEVRLQRGLDRIRQAFLNKGFLQTQVQVKEVNYNRVRSTLQPVIGIQRGPKFTVEVQGAKVSKGVIRSLVPVYQERTVDRELLMEGRRNLLDYFQGQGYFQAKVEFETGDPNSSGAQAVIYHVDRGDRYRMVHIEVDGNRYFDTETIRERMATIPGGTIRYRRGRFSRDLVEQDKDSIRELYRSNGFRDVKVTSRVEPNYKGKPLDLSLVVQIDEGVQWLVSGVDLSGVDLKLIPTIEGLISARRGQPYSPSSVAADRDAILAYYFNNGYPDATLEYSVAEDPKAHQAKLAYEVREGRRNFVREVLISGTVITHRDLITNRLTFAAGDPLSQASLVETQRRLYDLGIFSRVAIAVQNPDGLERDKTVLLQVDEAKKYSLMFGFGAELGRIGGGNDFTSPAGTAGFSPRVLLGITRTNFMGIGHTVGLTGRVSTYQRRALFTYTAPQFRGRERFSLTTNMLYDYSRDVRTFTAIRYEAGAQLNQRLNRRDFLQYRLTYRQVDVPSESLNIDPSLIPIYSQPDRAGLISSSYVRDRRDDPLDSTRGSYSTFDGGVASRWLGSSTQYTRLVTRNTTYHKIGRDVVFARSTSFGWLYNYALTPIPLPEKFYAGGSSTHRGFPDNQAGPRDLVTGFPIGGDAFFLNGLELRFPLIGTVVGGVLFLDSGNVYTNVNTISFRYKQRDPTDFDYMVQAPGLGFRFKTPIGPIRLDLAYGLNSPRFYGFEGTREDLINGGGGQSVLQRVRPFQFHFSIGQTF